MVHDYFRSSSKNFLAVPRTKLKTYGDRASAFSAAAPISQIDIKLYEFTPLFPIQYQLNMEYLRAASWAPYHLVYMLIIYRKLHKIALLNAM